MLSGFLIGGLLFAELRQTGGLRVGRFLTRREFKILPSYLILLAVHIVLQKAKRGGPPLAYMRSILRPMMPCFLFVQSYFRVPPSLAHTWSLGVEEHFYLLLPLVLVAMTKLGKVGGARDRIALVPLVSLLLILGCTALRWFQNGHHPYSWTHLSPTHLRIDGLFFGVFLAYVSRYHPATFIRVGSYAVSLCVLGLLCVGTALVPSLTRETPFGFTIGYTLMYLGYGAILVAMVNAPRYYRLPLRPMKVLASVGLYSYPIYLCHQELSRFPIMLMVQHGYVPLRPSGRWLVFMLAYVSLSVAEGCLLALMVERPMLRLRDRLFPSGASSSLAAELSEVVGASRPEGALANA